MKHPKNYIRRQSKFSTIMVNLMFIIIVVLGMAVVNHFATTRNKHTKETIGKMEKQLAMLEKERVQQKGLWDAIANNPQQVEGMLVRMGKRAMDYAKPFQVINMDRNGKPYRNQISIARLSSRRTERVAQRFSSDSTPRNVRSSTRKKR